MTPIEWFKQEFQGQVAIEHTKKRSWLTIRLDVYLNLIAHAEQLEKQSQAITLQNQSKSKAISELSNKVSVKCEGNIYLPNMTNYPFIPELSDFEIEKGLCGKHYNSNNDVHYNLVEGAKWYREQLRQKE